jgi:hypothetical protein
MGAGEVSRLRLLEGFTTVFFFWLAGVATVELKLSSLRLLAASLIFSEAPMSS